MILFDAALDWLANGLLAASWWQIVLYTLVTTHITIASVTIYLHRHQAHRAMNTAVESLCDVVSPQYSLAVKCAKDLAAGGVLIAACAASATGVITFWPYVGQSL